MLAGWGIFKGPGKGSIRDIVQGWVWRLSAFVRWFLSMSGLKVGQSGSAEQRTGKLRAVDP